LPFFASIVINSDPGPDVPSITKSIVNHVQTSLARQAYNIDDFGGYQAAALSVRDNLLVSSEPR
jgi:starch phosphorylase